MIYGSTLSSLLVVTGGPSWAQAEVAGYLMSLGPQSSRYVHDILDVLRTPTVGGVSVIPRRDTTVIRITAEKVGTLRPRRTGRGER
jgi:hypothetical protein